jgi:hypothetical protein
LCDIDRQDKIENCSKIAHLHHMSPDFRGFYDTFGDFWGFAMIQARKK